MKVNSSTNLFYLFCFRIVVASGFSREAFGMGAEALRPISEFLPRPYFAELKNSTALSVVTLSTPISNRRRHSSGLLTVQT